MFSPYIFVTVLKDAGYDEALFGISLSYKDGQIAHSEWWTPERKARMEEVARKLAHSGAGHDKFLESMVVWLIVDAPRYWWQEFDTYRIGVTKQSESTMHTITKRNLDMGDFELGSVTYEQLDAINRAIERGDLYDVKRMLPEGFMQSRMVCLNYKALQNIILQRRNHKLPHWRKFIADIINEVEHPELLPGLGNTEEPLD